MHRFSKISKKYILPGILFMALLCGCSGKNAAEAPEPEAVEKITEKAESQANEGEETSKEQGNENENAVTFEGKDMEGNTISQTICENSKLTMINVWATYCNPCLNEMPELGELATEYDAKDFQLIGIISDVLEGQDEESIAYAADLIEETGADYPHMLLNESLYYGLLQDVSAVPTTFFLNEKGEILDVVVGAMDKSRWEEKINGLLEEL